MKKCEVSGKKEREGEGGLGICEYVCTGYINKISAARGEDVADIHSSHVRQRVNSRKGSESEE